MLISFLQGVVNIFFSARFRVEGDSMLPLLRGGESVFVVRTRFKWNRLRRGDLAVFERPSAGGGATIKRVVGLPGEDIKIADDKVYVDGELLAEDYTQGAGKAVEKEWFNGTEEYFLLADNRDEGADSRNYGPVAGDLIKGRAWFRCWPPTQWRPLGRR